MALSWVSWLAPAAYPFRLLQTVVHELGHGLAALATGGEFVRFVVFADGSGLAYTAGGWRLAVIPAGYLGSAAFSAVLVLLGPRERAGRRALGALGIAVIALSLRYGLPSLLSPQIGGGLLAVVAGGGLGAAALGIALRAGGAWIVFTIHLVAFRGAIAALSDLLHLAGLSRLAAGPATDARSMAEVTLLPPLFWALAWAVTATAMLAGAFYLAWLRRD